MIWTFALCVFLSLATFKLVFGKEVADHVTPPAWVVVLLAVLSAAGGLSGWPVWVLFLAVGGVIVLQGLSTAIGRLALQADPVR